LKASFRFIAFEANILNALADALIPRTEKIPERPSEVGIVDSVQAALRASHFAVRWTFRFGLWMLQILALFFHGCLRPLTFMKPSDQEAYLAWWHQIRFFPVHLVCRLVEVYIRINYYASPEVYSHVGYTVRQPDRTPSRDLYGAGLIHRLEESVEEETEVCVIGSGAGGAVVAKELAELGHRVILIEEGGRFDLNDFHDEATRRSQKMYREGGIMMTMGFPPVLLPLGKAIGGTTIINSGTCFRTPDKVLQLWREKFGLKDLTEAEMKPYFERVESTINVMEVPEDLLGGSGKIIARGLEKLNLPGHPLHRNIKGCQGSGLCCFGCPTDGKQSVQLNYIPMALKAGAKLYAQCRVTGLKVENGKIHSVECRSALDPHKTLKVKAKIVVVAAGSIGTPLLLMANRLAKSSGQLGKNLTIHPAAKAYALFDEKVEGWKGVPQSYYADFLKHDGITFEGIFTPPSLSSSSILLGGRKHKEVMENFDRLASFGFLIRENTKGRVQRLPGGHPWITYQLTREDLYKCIQGLVWLARIFFAAGAKVVYPSIHTMPEVKKESDLEKIYSLNPKLTDLDLAAFHPLGTAMMGNDPKSSVVDPFGRIHEYENLFIADGSIFPTNLGVNPQVSIMAFAARNADFIHKRLS